MLGQRLGVRLAEQDQRDRADQHRLGRSTESLFCLIKLLERLVAGQLRCSGIKLRHEVVIVGIKPLRQFQRWLAMRPAGHRKIGINIDLRGFEVIPLRHESSQADRVEHMIVVAEVIHRNLIDPVLVLDRPGGVADLARGREDILLLGFARPEPLNCAFELALPPYPRIAEY